MFSRLLKDRILILGTEVNDEVANVMVSQMLYLASADPTADITIYINSPGGSVQAGLAIFDTMQVACYTLYIDNIFRNKNKVIIYESMTTSQYNFLL